MSENIMIAAAYEFLRRGYVGEQLQIEIANFTNWLSVRAAEGNPIKYPKVILKNWTTKTDNNAAPNDTEVIADFMQAIKCTNVDAICAVERFSFVDACLYVYLRAKPHKVQSIVDAIEAFGDANKVAVGEFFRLHNIRVLQYKWERVRV